MSYEVNIGIFESMNSTTNKSGELSKEDLEYLENFQFTLYAYVFPVIIISGLVGNILTVIVLNTKRMRSSTGSSTYLIALAIFDSVLLFITALTFSLPMIDHFRLWYYPLIHSAAYYFGLTSQMGSIYTTVAFTAERYIAVCNPLKSASLCTRSNARKCLIVILVCVSVYNLPRCFEYHYVRPTNDTISYNFTKFGALPSYRTGYIFVCYLISMFVFPFLTIITFNALIVHRIHKSNIRHSSIKHSTTSRSTESQLMNLFLFVIVAVFFICQLPALIDNILWVSLTEHAKYTTEYRIFTWISTMMVNINSAVNFLFYCCVGKKFRHILFRLIRCDNSQNDFTLTQTYSLRMSGSMRSTRSAQSRASSRKTNSHRNGHTNTAARLNRTESTDSNSKPCGNGKPCGSRGPELNRIDTINENDTSNLMPLLEISSDADQNTGMSQLDVKIENDTNNLLEITNDTYIALPGVKTNDYL